MLKVMEEDTLVVFEQKTEEGYLGFLKSEKLQPPKLAPPLCRLTSFL